MGNFLRLGPGTHRISVNGEGAQVVFTVGSVTSTTAVTPVVRNHVLVNGDSVVVPTGGSLHLSF